MIWLAAFVVLAVIFGAWHIYCIDSRLIWLEASNIESAVQQYRFNNALVHLEAKLLDRRLYEGLDVTLILNPKMLMIKCMGCDETVMTEPPESYGQIETELVICRKNHRCKDA